jgi:hypothetical protein
MLRADRSTPILEALRDLYPDTDPTVAISLYIEACKEGRFGADEQQIAIDHY